MTTATAISGRTLTVYTEVVDLYGPDERNGLEQGGVELHGAQMNVSMGLDADLEDFFQPGQRYKVTITRAEEDGDGNQD